MIRGRELGSCRVGGNRTVLHKEYGTKEEAETTRANLEAEPDQQKRDALSDVLGIEKWGGDMTDNKDTWIAEAATKLDVAAMHLNQAVEEGAASVHITEALRHIEEAKSKLRGEL